MTEVIEKAADANPEVMRRKVLDLEAALHAHAEGGVPLPEWVTNHYFHGGMYAREMHHPAGMVVVGKVHKKESLFIVTSGTVQIVLDDGVQTFSAPAILLTQPGAKRAVFSLEGATYMTVHRTNRKTVKGVEKEVVEVDPKAVYDTLNRPKMKELT